MLSPRPTGRGEGITAGCGGEGGWQAMTENPGDEIPPAPSGPCPDSPNGQHNEQPEGHDMVCSHCQARRPIS